jgi:hypothetical protein
VKPHFWVYEVSRLGDGYGKSGFIRATIAREPPRQFYMGDFPSDPFLLVSGKPGFLRLFCPD